MRHLMISLFMLIGFVLSPAAMACCQDPPPSPPPSEIPPPPPPPPPPPSVTMTTMRGGAAPADVRAHGSASVWGVLHNHIHINSPSSPEWIEVTWRNRIDGDYCDGGYTHGDAPAVKSGANEYVDQRMGRNGRVNFNIILVTEQGGIYSSEQVDASMWNGQVSFGFDPRQIGNVQNPKDIDIFVETRVDFWGTAGVTKTIPLRLVSSAGCYGNESYVIESDGSTSQIDDQSVGSQLFTVHVTSNGGKG